MAEIKKQIEIQEWQRAAKNSNTRQNQKEAIDARLYGVLPSLSLVTQCYNQAIQAGSITQGFRLQAYEAYKQLTQFNVDKELARFMPACIVWEDFTYESLKLEQFEQLLQHNDIHAFEKIFEDIIASKSPVNLLVSATFNKMQFIHVPAGISKTIELETLIDTNALCSELIIFVIEDGADVTIINKQKNHNGMLIRSIMGFIGMHTNVTYIHDALYHDGVFGISVETWSIGKDSLLKSIELSSGGRQTWIFKDYALDGIGALVDHISLSMLQNQEQHALISRQQHNDMNTKSSVCVKSLLLDKAHSFYRGTIAIKENASQSDADQQQRSLILSSSARTCAIPSLEIATHDVQCRHGSAAGRFKDEELWYLRAQGLDEQAAYSLLIDGFIKDHHLMRESASLLAHVHERLLPGSINL